MGLCHILLIERGVTSMICQCIVETWEILHRQIPLSRHACLTEQYYGMNTSVDVYLKTAHRSDVCFAQICDHMMCHVIVWRSVFLWTFKALTKHLFFLPRSRGSPQSLLKFPFYQTKSSVSACCFPVQGPSGRNPKTPYICIYFKC